MSSASNQHPPFSGVTLKLVLRFGVPEDVAKAKMVCKTWRDDLTEPASLAPESSRNAEDEKQQPAAGVVDDCEAVWKQAVTNSHPGVVKVLVAERAKSASEGGQAAQQDQSKPPPLDYRRLAESLSRKRKKPEPPEPTFRMENLLIIVELKREVKFKSADGDEKVYLEQLGAYPIEDCSSLLEECEIGVDEDKIKEQPLTLMGQNILCPEVHDGDLLKWGGEWHKFRQKIEDALRRQDTALWGSDFNPLVLISKEAMERNHLLCSLHLFRRDDWRKVTLFENAAMEYYDFFSNGMDGHSMLLVSIPDTRWGETTDPSAWNMAGCLARQKLKSQSCVAMVAEFGHENEMTWLREVRKSRFSTVNWTDAEDRQVMNFQKVDLGLSWIKMWWWSEFQSGDTGAPDVNSFSLLLEGLDWQ